MKKLMIVVLAAATATGVLAESKGFQLSLVPDVAIVDRDTAINGVSLGVWNENPSPKFQWQFGFVNGSTGDSVGVKWFVFLPTIYNYAENYKGLSWGLVNYASGDFVGAQLGAVNITGDMTGLQWGVVNYTGNMHGVQLGLVNWAKGVDEWAFQLGLVNVIEDNPWFSNFPSELATGFVIANWSFGGSK